MSTPTPWKKLLGNAIAAPEQRTPLGIRFQSNGFDSVRPKQVTKVLRWLENRNVPAALIAEYLEYANLFISDPRYIPLTIDSAYTEIRKLYLDCGGKWSDAARNITPGRILVICEPAPIWSEHWNTYAAGLAWMQKNLIQAVCVTANGIMSNPTQAGPLRRFSDLCVWEFGNYYSFKAGHRIKTPADEIGNQSPCAMRPRAALLAQPKQTSVIEP
jgi:hypothetical protein